MERVYQTVLHLCSNLHQEFGLDELRQIASEIGYDSTNKTKQEICYYLTEFFQRELGMVNVRQILNGTELENDIEVIVNLTLVIQDARPAYLFEANNYESIDIGLQKLEIIKEKFPNLSYTPDSSRYRIFIHKKSFKIKKYIDDDIEIGKILGFNCAADLNELNDKMIEYFTIRQYADDTSFYTEICPNKKEDEIEQILNSLSRKNKNIVEGLGYTYRIEYVKGYTIKYLDYKIYTKDLEFIRNNYDDILNHIWNFAGDQFVETFEDNYDYFQSKIDQIIVITDLDKRIKSLNYRQVCNQQAVSLIYNDILESDMKLDQTYLNEIMNTDFQS